jgi:hypothetical protein
MIAATGAVVRMSGAVIAGVRIIVRVSVMTMPAGVVQDSQEIDNGNPYPKNGQGGIEDK